MILPPKVSLDISKNNFVYKTCFIWNKCVQKVFVLPELDLKIQIVIPGSVTNSDFTASIPFVKNRIKCHINAKNCKDPEYIIIYTIVRQETRG